jgi:hypothetical protein
MAFSLRRSRRATKKGISEFNQGDIVEVSECVNGIVAHCGIVIIPRLATIDTVTEDRRQQ